jgi:major tropism determinant Mtd-like protein
VKVTLFMKTIRYLLFLLLEMAACGASPTFDAVTAGTVTATTTLNAPASFTLPVAKISDLATWAGSTSLVTLGTGAITALTEDASPSAANDYVMIFDASANAYKKVKLELLGVNGGTGTLDLSGYTVILPTANHSLFLRKGTAAAVAAITLAEAEPAFATDTKTIYIGDGATAGGKGVDMLEAAQSITAIKTHTQAIPWIVTGGSGSATTVVRPVTFTIGSINQAPLLQWQALSLFKITQGSGGTATGGGVGGYTGDLTPAGFGVVGMTQGSGGNSSGGTGGYGGGFSMGAYPGLITFMGGNGGTSATVGVNGGSVRAINTPIIVQSGTGGTAGSAVGGNGGAGGGVTGGILLRGGNGGVGGTTGVGGDGGDANTVMYAIAGNGSNGSGATAGAVGGFTGQIRLDGGNASGTVIGGGGGLLDLRGVGTIAGGNLVLSGGINRITTSNSSGPQILYFLNNVTGTIVPAEGVTEWVPLTAETVVWNDDYLDETVHLAPAGTLAELTLSVPISDQARIGQVLRVFTTQKITALTMDGAGAPTFLGTALTTLKANSGAAFQCVAEDVWIRLDTIPVAEVTGSTPVTGATVSWNTHQLDETVYLTPAGTLATLTLSVPAVAASRIGQILRVFTTETLTAITMDGADAPTFQGTALTTLAAEAGAAFQCVAADVWIRLY